MSNLLTIHNAFATACYLRAPQLEYQFGYGSYMEAQYVSHLNKNNPNKPNKYPRVLLEIPTFNTTILDKDAVTNWRFKAIFADLPHVDSNTKAPKHKKYTEVRVLSELHSIGVHTLAEFVKILKAEGIRNIEIDNSPMSGDTELHQSLMDGAVVVDFTFNITTREKLDCTVITKTDKLPTPLDNTQNIIPIESENDLMYVPR
jgi:hypothetical protein